MIFAVHRKPPADMTKPALTMQAEGYNRSETPYY